MAPPLISVIIPAYNCAAYLPAAIQSVFDQTYSPVEIVVVNDGSPDNTDEAVQPYLERIIYVKQKNKGLSGARNTGFRASHGQYVCFLDADDTLLPHKFEKQMAVFERYPDLGVVLCGYQNITEDGQMVMRDAYKNWHRDALERLLNHEVFPPHAPLIRRAALENSPLFPEDIVTAESQEDWQLWLDMALNGVAFSSVPEPLCQYRYRPGSISSYPLRHLDGARRVVKLLRQNPKAAPYHKQIERLSAIVEMERTARAWQAGKPDLAFETLAEAFAQSPTFWMEPFTWQRLFITSLPFEKYIEWSKSPDPQQFKEIIIEKYLAEFPDAISQKNRGKLRAAAWLMLADLAYSAGIDALRKNALHNAWLSSGKVCFSTQGFPAFARALLGPKLIARLKNRKTSGA